MRFDVDKATLKPQAQALIDAANTAPDGEDNPAGRALDRRVEVVLKN